MAYTVKRWDSWSELDGLKGLPGLEALLNAQRQEGWRMVQMVVHSEDIYVLVFEDGH